MEFKLLPSKWLNKKNGLEVHSEERAAANGNPNEHPVYSLQAEMNRLFEDFFRASEMPFLGRSFGLSPFSSLEQNAIGPRVDVHETEKELRISAELPGLNGEKKQECEQNVKGWYRMERSYGAFSRSVSLPCEVDNDSCKASFKNGVLTVSLTKTPQAQANTKSIPIKKE